MLAAYGYRCQPTPGARSFTALMGFVTFWSFIYALEIGAPDLGSKVLFAKIEYLGIVSVPVMWLIFTFEFAEHKIPLKYDGLPFLMVIPTVTVVLVLTNEMHHLYWSRTELDPSGGFLVVGAGFWYIVNSIYSYLLIMIGAVVLVQLYLRSKTFYREQIAALFIGCAAPWVGNILYMSGVLPWKYLDLTTFAFMISGIAFAWGFFYTKFLDVVPVARERIIEGMMDLILVFDGKGRLVEANPAALKVLSGGTQGIIGKPMEDVLKEWPKLLELIIELQPLVQCEPDQKDADVASDIHTISLKYGERTMHYDMKSSNLCDKKGIYRGRIVFLRDVTSRVEAEEKLKKAHDGLEGLVKERTSDLNKERDLLGHIMETSPVGIVKVDRDGRIVFANAQAEKVLGLKRDTITKRSYNSPEWKNSNMDGRPLSDEELPFSIVMRTGRMVSDVRHMIEWPDGRKVKLSVNASPLLDEGGKVQGMVATVEDITQRLDDEHARLEANRNYRTIFESVKDGLLVIDPVDGSIIDLNKTVLDMTGYSREDIQGLSLKKIFLPSSPYTFEEAVWFTKKAFKEGSAVFEWKFNRKDGRTIWLEVGLTRTRIQGRDLILGVARDISDRKDSEKRKNELLMTKARAEVMGFLMSALPVFAASIPAEARAVLIKNFGERFEKTLKVRFDSEMDELKLDRSRPSVNGNDTSMVFDIYIEWLVALFSSFGTQARGRPGKDRGHLELLSCPWVEAARGNPILCLICRTMVMRSFTWTGMDGTSAQISSIAAGAPNCWFDLYLHSPDGLEKAPDRS